MVARLALTGRGPLHRWLRSGDTAAVIPPPPRCSPAPPAPGWWRQPPPDPARPVGEGGSRNFVAPSPAGNCSCSFGQSWGSCPARGGSPEVGRLSTGETTRAGRPSGPGVITPGCRESPPGASPGDGAARRAPPSPGECGVAVPATALAMGAATRSTDCRPHGSEADGVAAGRPGDGEMHSPGRVLIPDFGGKRRRNLPHMISLENVSILYNNRPYCTPRRREAEKVAHIRTWSPFRFLGGHRTVVRESKQHGLHLIATPSMANPSGAPRPVSPQHY